MPIVVRRSVPRPIVSLRFWRGIRAALVIVAALYIAAALAVVAWLA